MATSCISPGSAHLSGNLGERDFDDQDSWGGLDHQQTMGLEATFVNELNGWGPEIGFAYGEDDRRGLIGELEADVTELYVGLRKEFNPFARTHFFLSGGYSLFEVEGTASFIREPDLSLEDNDRSLAPYIQGGAYYMVTDTVTAGLQYRYSFKNEEVEVFSEEPNLDGGLLLFTVGWHF